MIMRISISCLRCGVWFDNLWDLVEHRAQHDVHAAPDLAELPGRAIGPAAGPATSAGASRKEARS